MTVTIELTAELEDWIARKIEAGHFGSAAEFVNARLAQALLEERLEEAFREPATALTNEDWDQARQRLERTIAERE
jgi:Arc/MetJ-type ribon-helix-helix transcriptional regulator